MMLRLVSGTFVAAVLVLAQPPAAPSFDVASIKVSQPGRVGGNPFGDNIKATPGSLTMRSSTLKACIAWAYHVFEYQVTAPDWAGSDRYEIVAKAAGPAAEPELRVMLQALLADRFHLTFHRQTKEMSAYLLVVGKNGPKIEESKSEGESEIQPDQKTMSIMVHRVPISQLVDVLSKVFQMPVVDTTGLTKRYDVTINVAKYIQQSGDRPDPLSIIQMGLQEELGLKLESKKVPLDLLIVDHAEKVPTEN
jgi:uncharacterized protein (TIGR03435 family)